MYRFEPPPLPGAGGGSEPADPYATPAPAQGQTPAPTSSNPYAVAPGGPWGPPGGNLHPRGTLALVLGIIGCCGLPLFGPVAWAIAQGSLREADASPYPVTNRGHLVAARILGMVGTGMLAVGLLTFGLAVVYALILAGNAP